MYTRSRGDRYALSALTKRRATLAAEIANLKAQLQHRKQMLLHVDATLKLLDPSIDPAAIRNKRLPKRVKLFRQGELGRLILGTIRKADRPVATAEIVTAILAAGGHGEGARVTVGPRVRGNLAYLERRGKVAKSGVGRMTRWVLAKDIGASSA
jgi:hypothetical protein